MKSKTNKGFILYHVDIIAECGNKRISARKEFVSMKKSNWFDTVFLPSLFEYAGVGQSKRISEKQAECFERQHGVFEKQHTNLSYFGVSYVTCTTYTYLWNDRTVEVMHSRTGITIHFGMTKEEEQEYQKRLEKSRDSKDMDSIARMKERRPEKFKEKFEKAAENLLLCILLFDASAASEDDSDFEDALFYLEDAEKRYYKYYFA